MFKKLTVPLLFFTFLFLTLGGVGAAEEVEIDVWHSMSADYGLEIIEEFGEEFNEKHDDIHVEVVYSGGYDETLEGAQAALAAGDPPNVSMFEQTRGAAFVDAEAVLDVEPFFEESEIDFDGFFEELMETATYDDTIYGIPYNTSTPLLYYNKDMFEEAGLDPEDPPEDWDEVLEYSQQINEELDVYGLDFYHWGWIFENWLGTFGAEIIDEDMTEFTMNSPEAVEAMEFAQDMVHEYEVATYGTGGEGYDLFFGEELAMTQRSTAALVSNIESSEDVFELGVAKSPAGPEGRSVPFGGANFFMFDTGTEAEQEASFKFLEYIVQPENFAYFAAETGYMAAHEDAYNHEILQERLEEEPRAQVTYDQIPYGNPRPQVPFWGEIHEETNWFFEQQFAEQADVQEALDQVVETGNRLLGVYDLAPVD